MIDAPASKRAALAALLPAPTTPQWGIVLHYEDGMNSDKEYRIVADGATTLFQWGRRGADGQTKGATHASPAAATAAAVKQWASKETKGYWPTTGLLTSTTSWTAGKRSWDHNPIRYLTTAYRDAAANIAKARTGGFIVLVQTPPHDAPYAGIDLLAKLTALSATPRQSDFGRSEFALVAVTAATIDILAALCPVAVKLGPRSDEAARTVGQIASVLAEDTNGESSRIRLDRALEAARLLV